MCWQTGAVERIFVVPDWRDKGLVEYLIAKAFEYHYGNGRTSVETLVNETDDESKRLLTSMGYSFSVKLELLGLDLES
ncbi:GNAT family N-acetyltransferase [Paenibacillus sp. FJAT-27812]|uniref:GNAT family N-acetyltransferase n=1 Tax=Paenibacillus sp. FJAT-27812 TaxID=1684143 RepID=UPI0006A7D74B|nr:GNAT family N-acetyltransferase [Paenibacillus sp. FJAT-27812]